MRSSQVGVPDSLREAALKEVIWRLGGSTRRLESAFTGERRGLLSLSDFIHGLHVIGLQDEDLQGLGCNDSADAFALLDRSSRGSVLLEELTRPRPQRSACARLRRSASTDAFSSRGLENDMREDLDSMLELLRQRQEELTHLGEAFKVQGSRHDSQRSDASAARKRLEDLQEALRRRSAEELQELAEAQELNSSARRFTEKLQNVEQDCMRMEARLLEMGQVMEEDEAKMERCRDLCQEGRMEVQGLQERAAELEAHGAHLPAHAAESEQQALRRLQHLKQERQQELAVANARPSRPSAFASARNARVASVAHGVAELAEALQRRTGRAAAELTAARRHAEDLEAKAQEKSQQLESCQLKLKSMRRRQEEESQQMWLRSADFARRAAERCRENDREMAAEIADLKAKTAKLSASFASGNQELHAEQAHHALEEALEEGRATSRICRSEVSCLKKELAAEQRLAQEHEQGHFEEEQLAQILAKDCEQLWASLAHSKELAAHKSLSRPT
ncbi:unnamed protein product [Effrenium voratum]|nr:unnamed protein product [Effrenium voratum]